MTRDPAEVRDRALAAVARALDTPALDAEARLEAVREAGRRLDGDPEAVLRLLVERDARRGATVAEIRARMAEMSALVDTLSAPPLLGAMVVGRASHPASGAPLLRVVAGEQVLLAGLAPGIDERAAVPGAEAYLGPERNVVLGLAPPGAARRGECMAFSRALGAGRLLVRDRDVEVAVVAAAGLDPGSLEPGDLVLVERRGGVALERVDAPEAGTEVLLERFDEVGIEAFAGHDALREDVLRRVVWPVVHRRRARAFGLGERAPRVLLTGAPGTGKSTLMKAISGELGRAGGAPCRVARVSGSDLERAYVGETQRALRAVAASLERHDGPAVLYWEEIESFARQRGTLGNVHGDRFLATLLATLEGHGERGRIIVVAATNRPDLLDTALRSRFDVEIEVPRPGREAARAILGCHLPAGLAYDGAAAGRAALCERALSRLYDPNSAPGPVARVRLRDGSAREVAVRDLVSGRLLEQIAARTRELAFQRAIEGGDGGIGAVDLDRALDECLERLRWTLTAANAHAYLADLPAEVGVAAVEPGPRPLGHARFVAPAALAP